ncbi:MAG: GNAT family N-acetyltransferase [Hyphomicrobium sp.]|nr:MAG: GNAT family N-acetyltransferase [Hyphomicrobium sp.]
MSPPTIRLATLIDIPAIATIYQPQVIEGTATFELAPPDQAEMRRRFETITASGFPYLAAETDGRLAGYAYAQAFRARPAYRFTVEDSIYVAEGVQGRGIGKALLSALVDRCTDLGFRQMIAVIGDSERQAPSIALHRALGFKVVGALPAVGFKHGRWLDSVQMQRPLGAGDTQPPTGS